MAACFTEAGYPATVDGSGVSVPSGSRDSAFMEVVQTCDATVGVVPYEPPTPSFLREHYAEQMATKRCLEGEGYDIAEPPSEDVFVETYTTSEPWLPYTSIVEIDVSDAEWDRLNEVCPQPG